MISFPDIAVIIIVVEWFAVEMLVLWCYYRML